MKTRIKSAPLRFAVVGLGHIAQAAVLPAFKHARAHVELTAFASDTPAKLKTLGKRYGVKHLAAYAQSDELFASGAVDAVYVALPNTLHAEWTLRAAKAGLHVLCEKPLAATVHDCERMIEVCSKNSVQLMTAYRLHFERCNLEVGDLVRRGRLGEPRFFNSQFSMQVKAGNIRTRGDLAGGPEWDIGIYCINAARMVFAEEPTEVWATATHTKDPRFREVPESVHAVLRFSNDRLANFVASFGAADRARYEVVGTKGSIAVDPAFEYAGALGYELRVGEKSTKKTFAKRDQFAPELIHFAQSVRAGRSPEPSGKEGLIDVAIIEAIHRSIERGRWEKIRAPRRKRRPSLKQEIRRPAVPREPALVQVEAGHA